MAFCCDSRVLHHALEMNYGWHEQDALFGLVAGLLICLLPGLTPATEMPVVNVPRWEMHEFSAKGRSDAGNLFRDTAWVGEFRSPSGRTKVLEGFYDGDETWRLRFAP